MATTWQLSGFIDDLASGEPTPGGGSAAALAGALGAALAAMVARLTTGRPRYAAVEGQMQAALETAEALRAQLTRLVATDAAAYEEVRAAYRLPKSTQAEQAARAAAIQDALKAASRTPLDTMEACLAAMRLGRQVVQLGNPNAATDGAVGVLLAHAGLQGAALNVQVNLGGIEDRQFAAHARRAVDEALAEAGPLAAQALAHVESRL